MNAYTYTALIKGFLLDVVAGMFGDEGDEFGSTIDAHLDSVVPRAPPREDSGSDSVILVFGEDNRATSNPHNMDLLMLRQDELERAQARLLEQVEESRSLLVDARRRIEALEVPGTPEQQLTVSPKFSSVTRWTDRRSKRGTDQHPDLCRSERHSDLTVREASVYIAEDRRVRCEEAWMTEGHQVSASVWEAPLLIGVDVVTSLSILVGFLLNATVQLLVCAVAFSSFTENDFPTTIEILTWRYGIAHDRTWADPTTGASLGSRVCGGDKSLAVAVDQRSVKAEIDEYTGNVNLAHLFQIKLPQGALLSMLTITMWFLVVAAELVQSTSFCVGVLVLFSVGGEMACEGR